MTEKKLESMLRKGMQAVGQVVEKAIGKAQAAKQTMVSTAASPAPPATLEGLLPLAKIKDLLRTSSEKTIASFLPALTDRRVLELADGVGRHAMALKEHGARVVVSTEIGAGAAQATPDAVSRLFTVRAWVHRLPYRDGAFDCVVANLVTPAQGDVSRALKEIGRVLASGGMLVVTDFHPFGAFARRGPTRVRPGETMLRGLGDYYKVARLAGLKVQDARETFIDETTRTAFASTEEKQAYRQLRDTPLILGLLAKKGVGEAA